MLRLLCLAALGIHLAACSPGSPTPEATTPADSLALRLVDASGGWEAWDALPTLRFDWSVERDTAVLVTVRHLWDREGDRARVEWEVGDDSIAVAMIDLAASRPEAPSAQVFVNGEPATVADSLDHAAYARFINDSYWLLAPLKTFDPGVVRDLEADSADASSDVIRLSFGDVGLTPGDQYWLRVGSDGALRTWTYQLEGDTTRTMWGWSDPVSVDGPRGPVVFLTRKTKPDGTAIVTRPSADVPPEAWTSPLPILR